MQINKSLTKQVTKRKNLQKTFLKQSADIIPISQQKVTKSVFTDDDFKKIFKSL